eukprot:scaffold781_cov132-Cylindrotheca_fusiformis.AAC.4
MCGPGVKIHECRGKYKSCSSDDCDFARCTAGDTECFYSCSDGTCQRVYSCDDGDCSSTYSYSTCIDKHCNHISVSGGGGGGSGGGGGGGSGGGGGGSGGGSSGSSSSSGGGGGNGGSSSGGNGGGSSSSSGANGADGSSSSYYNAASLENNSNKSESGMLRSWYSVAGIVLAALLASVVIANVLLHRRPRSNGDDHPLTGALERRMQLFTRGIPKMRWRKPADPSSYQLEQDSTIV